MRRADADDDGVFLDHSIADFTGGGGADERDAGENRLEVTLKGPDPVLVEDAREDLDKRMIRRVGRETVAWTRSSRWR